MLDRFLSQKSDIRSICLDVSGLDRFGLSLSDWEHLAAVIFDLFKLIFDEYCGYVALVGEIAENFGRCNQIV